MTDLEKDLKVENWLSIFTYDAFKYAAVGGQLIVDITEEGGLTLHLPDINPNSPGLNKKFRRLLEAMQKESTP